MAWRSRPSLGRASTKRPVEPGWVEKWTAGPQAFALFPVRSAHPSSRACFRICVEDGRPRCHINRRGRGSIRQWRQSSHVSLARHGQITPRTCRGYRIFRPRHCPLALAVTRAWARHGSSHRLGRRKFPINRCVRTVCGQQPHTRAPCNIAPPARPQCMPRVSGSSASPAFSARRTSPIPVAKFINSSRVTSGSIAIRM